MKDLILKQISGKVGGKNAIKCRELKSQLNISLSVGSIQGIVEELRIEGHRICANQKGYFVPNSDEEWDEWVAAYRRRTMKQLKTLSVITKHDYTQKGEVFKATDTDFLEAGFEQSEYDDNLFTFSKSSVDHSCIRKSNQRNPYWLYSWGQNILRFATVEQFKSIHQVYLLQE